MLAPNAMQAALAAADRQAIIDSFSRLQGYWKEGRWLDRRNRYRRSASGRVTKAKGSYRHLELSDYIAASTVGHCFDGWSYLGRATEAELAGDPGAARHLGYYAELRAAMSILAAEGIGIFNNRHVVVGKRRRCTAVAGSHPTHIAAWQALDQWSQSLAGMNRVLSVITPNGTALAEWADHFGGAPGFVARNWLQEWGLDLSRFESDKKARNTASYRPALDARRGPRGFSETLRAIDELWTLCDPGGVGGFPYLDRHLLREVLVELFGIGGDSRRTMAGRQRYARRVGQMLDAINTGPLRGEIEKFLTFQTDGSRPSLLIDASGKRPADHVDHSKEVLARATLLLRVATGSVSDLLRQSNSDFATELQFWWNGPAVRRRLWSEGMVPASFVDLWDDIGDALEDAGAWSASEDQEISHWGFWRERATAAWTLSTAEPVFLWGVV